MSKAFDKFWHSDQGRAYRGSAQYEDAERIWNAAIREAALVPRSHFEAMVDNCNDQASFELGVVSRLIMDLAD